MKLSWNFNKVNPRFKNREATQGEFFTNDTELRGFIREAVQNSLDAKRSRVKGPVRVRIFVSGDQAALSPEKAARWFENGWPHFHAEGSGLRDAPRLDEPCRFIAYEDSGTTGLTGDVTQYHEVAGVKNPFYYFFRAEGQSNKTDGGRGRWGLGKFVFPRSSRIRSFFGLTVRHDDRKRLLVGQSILRSHHVGEKSFTPDGWFGKKPDRNEASLPVSDQRCINKFIADFGLKRGEDPGLTLVVPYCDERWTRAAVIEAVVQDYFFPVLNGQLVVTVEDADARSVLDSATLETVAGTCSRALQQTMNPLIALTKWSLVHKNDVLSCVPLLQEPAASGSGFSLPDSTKSELRSLWKAAGKVSVRVPVTVHPKDGSPRTTFFDAFVERAEGSLQNRPVFVRDGIVISDVRSRPIRDVNAIVSITDPALTGFLGDAENPAHTEWSEESSHFKGKYLQGAATLRFVRNTVADLCQMLVESAEDEDPVLLLDVFSVGAGKNQAGVPVNFAAMSSKATAPDFSRLKTAPSTPRKRKPFKLNSRKGGFRIAEPAGSNELCPRLDVYVAYDCRRGNPLSRFAETDFHLSADPVLIKSQLAIVQVLAPNHLVVYPQKPGFSVTVAGFDINRDLFVQVRTAEASVGKQRRAG
jgi:hypothetical protein